MPSVSFAEPVSVSSAPFESVDYFSGRQSLVIFHGVRLKKVWKVSVPVDSADVILSEDQTVYTTLNLVNAQEDYGSLDWIKAEKVVVVVRARTDLILWQKFLTRVRKQQELEKKKWTESIRVLPPIME